MNCSLQIETLRAPAPCDDVRAGVRRLLLVPTDDIETINATPAAMPQTFGGHVTIGTPAMTDLAVTLQSGAEFVEIYCQRNLGELKYTITGSGENRAVRATLEVVHPGMRKRLMGFLALFSNREVLLLCQLANGDWHMIGDRDRGAALADGTEATSGRTPGDQNGATMMWEWFTRRPQIMFDGWSPDNAVYGVEMFRNAWLLTAEDGRVVAAENGKMIEITKY